MENKTGEGSSSQPPKQVVFSEDLKGEDLSGLVSRIQQLDIIGALTDLEQEQVENIDEMRKNPIVKLMCEEYGFGSNDAIYLVFRLSIYILKQETRREKYLEDKRSLHIHGVEKKIFDFLASQKETNMKKMTKTAKRFSLLRQEAHPDCKKMQGLWRFLNENTIRENPVLVQDLMFLHTKLREFGSSFHAIEKSYLKFVFPSLQIIQEPATPEEFGPAQMAVARRNFVSKLETYIKRQKFIRGTPVTVTPDSLKLKPYEYVILKDWRLRSQDFLQLPKQQRTQQRVAFFKSMIEKYESNDVIRFKDLGKEQEYLLFVGLDVLRTTDSDETDFDAFFMSEMFKKSEDHQTKTIFQCYLSIILGFLPSSSETPICNE